MPMRRAPKPIPLAPIHRPAWRRWFRRNCSCGLRWKTCPDKRLAVPVEPQRVEPPMRADPPHWNQQTEILWIGNLLTRGQAYRANGGRHA